VAERDGTGGRPARSGLVAAVLAGGLWYALVGGTWLLAELVAPVEGGAIGAPLALPLLPAELLRLAGAALVASLAVAVAVRRPSPVALGVLTAGAVAAGLAVRALRGSPDDFWSDPRLLVPELLVLGAATAVGLAVGLWAGRRPERLAVALATASPVLVVPVQAAVIDVVRLSGGSRYDGATAVSGLDVVALAAAGLSGLLLVRYRRGRWLVPVGAYLAVAAVGIPALGYSLGQVRLGATPGLDDLVGGLVDVLPPVAASGYTWRPVVALVIGAVAAVLLRRRDADRPPPGSTGTAAGVRPA
jgi:hypothetical protein